jgi:Na+/H+ antiporter NhaD/arsenite permease-like protein
MVLTDCIVLFPFHLPIPIPQVLRDRWWDLLASWRIIPKRRKEQHAQKWRFPVDLTTGPLIGVLFLLAILAIGRQEVHDGTVGADHIFPIDVMVFFVTLAYIAISIDASGLIRFLSFKVLQRGGKNGRLLFLYLYLFFFACASFVGNDPIVLSGTAFLAYLTRVSRNISEPTAWIFTQFSIANLASAILVSSNPTNLVLAGAFDIQYIEYTANMIVPVIVTAIILCPFLIFVQFRSPKLIPREIELHELPEDRKGRDPVNPNIPSARAERAEKEQDEEEERLISLEEILNPYLDKKSAIFAGTVMAITLISVLALNAVADKFPSGFQVYWVTLPAAVIVFSWDLTYGWIHREATKETMAKLRAEVEEADAQGEKRLDGENLDSGKSSDKDVALPAAVVNRTPSGDTPSPPGEGEPEKVLDASDDDLQHRHQPVTLQLEVQHLYRRAQVTFPTATMVLTLLPLPLVPFGFCMFILVQALVTRGWVTGKFNHESFLFDFNTDDPLLH